MHKFEIFFMDGTSKIYNFHVNVLLTVRDIANEVFGTKNVLKVHRVVEAR